MVESTGTNVQLVSKDVPAHVLEGTGLGNEEVGKDHLQTPRVKLLQQLSNEVDKNHSEYIEGATPGDFINSVTKENYGVDMYVLNVKFTEDFVVWKKREIGGGLVGNFKSLAEATDYLTSNDLDVDHFLSELGWREFSYSLLYYFPKLPRNNLKSKFDSFAWKEDAVVQWLDDSNLGSQGNLEEVERSTGFWPFLLKKLLSLSGGNPLREEHHERLEELFIEAKDELGKGELSYSAAWGLGISARRITVSTVGLPEAIRRLAGFHLPVTLALSLLCVDLGAQSNFTALKVSDKTEYVSTSFNPNF